MDDEILNELKKQTKLLKEHNNWLKFLALPKFKEIIISTLDSEKKKHVYELSDGKNSSPKISQKLSDEGISISDQAVRDYWKNWFSLGIVIPSKEYEKRYQKIIDLEELGIV